MERGLRRFASGTAAAATGWSPSDVLSMSTQAKQGLLEILKGVTEQVVLPSADLVILVVFLGKPGGGERPIALMGLVYRILASIRRPGSTHWSDGAAGHWDTVVRKSSALRAALKRSFRAEVAWLTGEESTGSLWDIEKLYDSIGICDVAQMGMKMGYPPLELALACQAHTAPRMLKAEDVVSDLQSGLDTSILAGGLHSNNFARLVVYGMLAEAHNRWGPDAPLIYVDDMAQVITGKPKEVTRILVETSSHLVESLRAKGFTVSIKSVMVSASSNAVQEAVRILGSRGIEVSMSNAARDPGIDFIAGRRRSTVVSDSRCDKARIRASRVRGLAKSNGKARKPTATGTMPQAAWGSSAMGMKEYRIDEMRSFYVHSLGCKTAGRCFVTLLALGFGMAKDPAITVRVDQFCDFAFVWNTLTHKEKGKAMLAWQKLKGTLAEKKTRWLRVAGLMGATVASLLDIGWDPVRPNYWVHPGGKSATEVDRGLTKPQIAGAVEHYVAPMLWSRASRRTTGDVGMDGGADITTARKYVAPLRRKGLYKEAGLAMYIISGGQFTGERLGSFEGKELDEGIRACPRCGEACETLLHRYWSCPDNRNVKDEAMQASSRLATRALNGGYFEQAVWTRGIVPTSWYKEFTPPWEDTVAWEFRNGAHPLGPEEGAVGVFASDGSGGPCGNDPRLRRVGFASVQISLRVDGSFCLHWAKFGGVPGKQTVPRAETLGFFLSSLPTGLLGGRVGVWSMPSMLSTATVRITSRQ